MAQAINVCSTPVVTRLYTPAQMGVIALFISFFTFWSPALSLRYEYALLIAKDDAESHVVLRLAVAVVVGMSFLGLPVLWGLHRAEVLGFGLLPDWAPLAGVAILLGYGVFMVYRSWALRAGIVKQITKATVMRSAASATTSIALGLLTGGIPALFAAQFMASWAAMLKLTRNVRRHFVSSRPERVLGREIAAAAKRYVKFPLFETPSTWVNQLTASLPVPMIVTLFGASAAGWYGLARTIVGIPNAQIGTAVADVFQMEVSSAVVAGDATRVRGLFYKLMRKLALIGLLPMVGVMVLCPLLVPWVFGHAWREAGYVAAIIAPWMYVALIVSPLSGVLSALQAQEYKLIYDVVSIVLIAVAFLLAKAWHLGLLQFIAALSATAMLGYIVYAIVIVAVVEARLRTVAHGAD
ncbi:oligosaccharide flippase family protein [Rhodanobacter sp. DHB23]|uniref:oligosaccharide flippase family protein n=1 Tax=Rhodanobacter sp. DHB23 TaxID=2775923 RepID=UPI00177CD4DD|nr:oligosaccharide flippase family protein [Rhodanobacter sp. DHB23]MBD8872848.1 oligosaccharide flippase family protein [Rhodanobacter sp. DHB23]